MKPLLLCLVVLGWFAPLLALAQPRDRLSQLELRVEQMEGSYKSLAGPAFLAGVIAAWWAQTTRRNAWLWFFLGALFVPVTLIALLYLNARDRRRAAASTGSAAPE